MFSEGGNRFWLDLQWYLWQGLSRASGPWEHWAEYILSDLRLLLKRLPGLETLAWNDGTPLADEVTLNWIAEKVNDDMPGFSDEPAVATAAQTDDILALETEAMEKGTPRARRLRWSGCRVVRTWPHPAAAGCCVC